MESYILKLRCWSLKPEESGHVLLTRVKAIPVRRAIFLLGQSDAIWRDMVTEYLEIELVYLLEKPEVRLVVLEGQLHHKIYISEWVQVLKSHVFELFIILKLLSENCGMLKKPLEAEISLTELLLPRSK